MNDDQIDKSGSAVPALASSEARRKVTEFARDTIAGMPEWKREAYAQEAAQFEDMARVARDGR